MFVNKFVKLIYINKILIFSNNSNIKMNKYNKTVGLNKGMLAIFYNFKPTNNRKNIRINKY